MKKTILPLILFAAAAVAARAEDPANAAPQPDAGTVVLPAFVVTAQRPYEYQIQTDLSPTIDLNQVLADVQTDIRRVSRHEDRQLALQFRDPRMPNRARLFVPES